MDDLGRLMSPETMTMAGGLLLLVLLTMAMTCCYQRHCLTWVYVCHLPGRRGVGEKRLSLIAGGADNSISLNSGSPEYTAPSRSAKVNPNKFEELKAVSVA